MENGGLIKIELNHIANETVKEHFLETANDNRILAVALNLFHEEQKKGKSYACDSCIKRCDNARKS
ncbi:MAG: PhoH-like ATPase [Caldanaerobacter sp.]|nr:hypothetical protein [Caldanaerobacter sp.]MDI3519260.1 PhoH-like ATPase [Caldanaerobacter sp.]